MSIWILTIAYFDSEKQDTESRYGHFVSGDSECDSDMMMEMTLVECDYVEFNSEHEF